MFQVWRQYGFTPEFYNVAQGGVAANREGLKRQSLEIGFSDVLDMEAVWVHPRVLQYGPGRGGRQQGAIKETVP